MDTNPQQSLPSSRISSLKQSIPPLLWKLKRQPLLSVVLILLVLIGVLGYRYYELSQKSSSDLPRYTDHVLLVLSAKLDSQTTPSLLTLRFNTKVDVHELSHYFSLTPKIAGKFVKDEYSPSVVHYKFDKPYDGSYISLYITQGLTSLNNKTLLYDYETYFSLNTAYTPDQTDQTVSSEPYGRVKSYMKGRPIPLPSNKEIPTIYKSNAFTMLQFLTYTLDEKEGRGSVYSGNYIQKSIAHPPTEKLTNIPLDKEKRNMLLNPGVYYVEDNPENSYFIVVNSFGVTLRQDDQQVILGAFTPDGKKITDEVTFGLYNLKNTVNLLRDFTYSEANNKLPLEYPTRLDAVIAIFKNEVAFIPVEVPSSFADIQVTSNLDTDSKLFLYTDRPIYKPGDTVFIRGIVRQDSDSLYKTPSAGKTIYIQAYAFTNKPINLTATLDEYGTFYTNYVLSKDVDAQTQYAYLRASTKPFTDDNYQYTSASFEVLQYKKPEFEIKTAVEKDEYLKSDKLKFTISGNYFDGKPLTSKDVEYTLYTDNYYEVEKAVYNKNFNITSPGGMCGGGGVYDYFGTEYKKDTVTLNDKGEAVIEVSSDDKSLLSQKVTLVAKIIDKNKNEILSAATTIVHSAELNIFFIPSAERYSMGDEVVAPFYAEKLNGEKIADKSFSYKLIDYDYNNYYTNTETTKQTVIASGETKTDNNGKGIIKFAIPKEKAAGYKQLIVLTKDNKNNTAQNQKAITILTKEEEQASYIPRWGDRITQTYLKISSNQNSFKVNDTVKLTIESPKDLDVLLTFERGRIYAPRFLHLNKGNNELQFRVGEELSPSVTVVFSYFADGDYHTEGVSLNVPAMHKLLQIDLSANKSIYTPSETAELRIRTKDANGTPVAAQMSLGVVDKAIYALRKSATPPLHSSFYYFRPRRTNASSSLTGMGDWGGRGGGGGGGGGAPGSTADILYWNPTLKTDATGEVTIPIPLLGHKTTWKVQVLGSTLNAEVGQADTEFIVTSDVKGAKTKGTKKR